MSNVYLIGMPGSGKTTLGRLVAAQLGRQFVDLDAVIEEQAGKTISAIFADVGESGFRQKESVALTTLARQEGLLVATGGGIVVKPENIMCMKKSGLVIFLHRPLRDILADIAAEKRPLLQGDAQQALRLLYQKRVALYEKACHACFINQASPTEDCEMLCRLIQAEEAKIRN